MLSWPSLGAVLEEADACASAAADDESPSPFGDSDDVDLSDVLLIQRGYERGVEVVRVLLDGDDAALHPCNTAAALSCLSCCRSPA